MDETKGERRDRRRQAARRMKVDGKSCILLQRIVARRAEEAKKKGS